MGFSILFFSLVPSGLINLFPGNELEKTELSIFFKVTIKAVYFFNVIEVPLFVFRNFLSELLIGLVSFLRQVSPDLIVNPTEVVVLECSSRSNAHLFFAESLCVYLLDTEMLRS